MLTHAARPQARIGKVPQRLRHALTLGMALGRQPWAVGTTGGRPQTLRRESGMRGSSVAISSRSAPSLQVGWTRRTPAGQRRQVGQTACVGDGCGARNACKDPYLLWMHSRVRQGGEPASNGYGMSLPGANCVNPSKSPAGFCQLLYKLFDKSKQMFGALSLSNVASPSRPGDAEVAPEDANEQAPNWAKRSE